MTTVVIMRGPSGSGKSTLVRELMREHSLEDLPALAYCPDNFFTEGGKYNFDPSKLGEAHAENFYKFIEDLRYTHKYNLEALLIVDATNTRQAEYSPYYLAAEAYGANAILLEVVTDVKDCIHDNIHEVPEHSVRNQYKRMEPPAPFHNSLSVRRDTPIKEIVSKLLPERSEGV